MSDHFMTLRSKLFITHKCYISMKSKEKVSTIKRKSTCVWHLFMLFHCCFKTCCVLCISVGRTPFSLFELYVAASHIKVTFIYAQFTKASTNIPFEMSNLCSWAWSSGIVESLWFVLCRTQFLIKLIQL